MEIITSPAKRVISSVKNRETRRIERWNKFLDELKEKEGISSDLALAETLGVTRAFISAIRSGKRDMPMNLAESVFVRLDRKLNMREALMFVPTPIIRRTSIQFVPIQADEILLKRSKGLCELCGDTAPFESPPGIPYLETFHFLKGSFPRTKLIEVALCPNCNQKMIKLNLNIDRKTLEKRIKESGTIENGKSD